MDLKERKINFIREFFHLENEEVLARLEDILHSEKKKHNLEFEPMSLDEFKQRIDLSMADSMENRVTEVDELISEVSKWR